MTAHVFEQAFVACRCTRTILKPKGHLKLFLLARFNLATFINNDWHREQGTGTSLQPLSGIQISWPPPSEATIGDESNSDQNARESVFSTKITQPDLCIICQGLTKVSIHK